MRELKFKLRSNKKKCEDMLKSQTLGIRRQFTGLESAKKELKVKLGSKILEIVKSSEKLKEESTERPQISN